MTLAWLTDLHLNKVHDNHRLVFCNMLQKSDFNAVVITGDISEARMLPTHLRELGRACAPRPVYFVLGNHDFYGSSFDKVDSVVAEVCDEQKNLQHLGNGEMIRLSPNTVLVGHRGWGDGRMGWGSRTFARNPDFSWMEPLLLCKIFISMCSFFASRLRFYLVFALCVGYCGGAHAEDSNLDKILSDVQETLKTSPNNSAESSAQKRAPTGSIRTASGNSEEAPPIPDSFKRFIDTMWHNQISNNPDVWASDFAPHVSYGYANFASVSRSFIRDGRAKLINRYPERSYQMIDVSDLKSFGGKISGLWKFRYSYRGVKLASGQATVKFTVQLQGDRWQFVTYSEEVVRD